MHVMIIPRGHYLSPQIPLSGIFESHQVESLSRNGIKVGVLDPALIPFRFAPKSFPYVKSEYNKSVLVIREYRRSILPGRYTPVKLRRYLLRNAMRASWKNYVDQFGKPDIIHAHNLLSGGVIAEFLNSQYQIPYVVTEHSSAYSSSTEFVKSDAQELKYIVKNCSGVIAVSNRLLSNLIEVMPEIELIGNIVPNVVDPNFEDRINATIFPQQRKSDVIRIISIGNLIPRKDFKNLLNGFAQVFPLGQANLTIVGEGPEENELRELVHDLGIDKFVSFVGSPSRDSILDLLLNSDFFVLTSQAESFGVVIIEALSCGLPVVSTDSGGPRDILEEDQGLLVPAGDLEALCRSLAEMSRTFQLFDRDHISQTCLNKFGSKRFSEFLIEKYIAVLK